MIRKSKDKDLDAILNIWLAASIKAHDFIEASFWESQVDNMRTVYLPASDVFVYEEDEQILGFYALHGDSLAAIFVEPERQGNGIGSELLRHAKSERKELSLTVYKANTASCNFYRKHGFSVTQEQIDAPTGEPELVMTTALL